MTLPNGYSNIGPLLELLSREKPFNTYHELVPVKPVLRDSRRVMVKHAGATFGLVESENKIVICEELTQVIILPGAIEL